MNKQLPDSAKKVQDFLVENGFSYAVKELPDSTRTAEEAARAIGCSVAQIAKSLIFIDKASSLPILVIASGAYQVDIGKIEDATGLQLIKADAKFVKEKVGFAIGGVPPVGHLEKIRTLIDPTLKNYECLWAAAGTPFAVFQLHSSQIQKMTNGEFVEMSR
ncbi:MAG: YbaK/EbsC family protein [Rhabdochlamydiaceae bacterium]|jgi:prolyl-tRNA editing enzyme YbaK/EbsC (Cys-tRNA(Pro) deacylase)